MSALDFDLVSQVNRVGEIQGAFVYESVFCFLSNLKIVKKVSLDYKNLRFENVFGIVV